jgi:hypothetical protein
MEEKFDMDFIPIKFAFEEKIDNYLFDLNINKNDIFIGNNIKKEKEATFIKKKRNEQTKNEPRNDNIFKQVKVHSIEFITCTINNLLLNKINSFYKFNKNIVNKDFKRLTQKDYNIGLLEMKTKEILTENCDKEFNKDTLKQFNKIFQKNQKDKQLCLVNEFLNLKFIDIIKIFDMKAEEFYEKYHFYNDNLLEKKNFKNKKEMKELIESGIIPYLEKKIARTK